MLRLVFGRVLAGIVLVVLLTLLTYVVFFRVPVDLVIYISPDATEQERTELRDELGSISPSSSSGEDLLGVSAPRATSGRR